MITLRKRPGRQQPIPLYFPRKYASLLPLLAALFTACANTSEVPNIQLPAVEKFNSEVNVGRMILFGPFTSDTGSLHHIDTDEFIQYGLREEEINFDNISRLRDRAGKKSFLYQTPHSYVDGVDLFTALPHANCYGVFSVNSPIDQDIAFLLGSDDGMKIWVNQKLCFRINDARSMQRNTNIITVHLQKGLNFVLLKCYNGGGYWAFYLNMSRIDYAAEFYQHKFGYDFLEHCLLGANDSLKVNLNPCFTPLCDSTVLQVFNPAGKEMLSTKLPRGANWQIPLPHLDKGSYKCKILVPGDTLSEIFMIGNYHDVYDADSIKLSTGRPSGDFLVNTQTLFSRFRYLKSFGTRYGCDDQLYRKIATTLFDIAGIVNNAQFSNIPGRHLRGYISKVDGGTENYMVYVPGTYRKNVPIPLVMVIPWVGQKVPFIQSPHVAYLDKIDALTRLADKFGYAILWPAARIFERYNLNPIVSTSIFQAMNKVGEDYNIDSHRVYLYGVCSGGMFAMLLANRFPEYFAAIGVEGPELNYTKSKTMLAPSSDLFRYPTEWVKENNLLQMINNYQHIPLYIAHAPADHKSDYAISKTIYHQAKKQEFNIILDSVENITKTPSLDLYPDALLLRKMFVFFKDKVTTTPLSINFSTFQLKYNRAYWMTIDQMDTLHTLANIRAVFNNNNQLKITTKNIRRYSINLTQLPGLQRNKKLLVITNNDTTYFNIAPQADALHLSIDKQQQPELFEKNHDVEGPINDIFKDNFLLVTGDTGTKEERLANQTMVNKFIQNWQENNFNTCPVKTAAAVSNGDIARSNLILIGNPTTNSFIRRLVSKLPLKISANALDIGSRHIDGNSLGYTLIYPNPLNPKKYILLLGSNNSSIVHMVPDLQYTGWYDYEVKNVISEAILIKGYFDEYWK
ncbi:hypothetical protein HGH93_00125 [Chitinophaga polysaccharea]|uniref:PHB depolymerase family esterase n=1 Tax=Chitinophaga polysaccharea TaxID=1293035 RepID=UPI0014555755|nr:PHB depolymerase family esterase [Chitinophaga polysaccharea]NLR56485.1 hypothetical protein [Chitinophaga polysaccharea]